MKKTTLLPLLITSAGLVPLAAALFFLPKPTLAMPAAEVAASPGAHILEEPIQTLPEHVDIDPRKAALGALLFVDKRLSHDNTLSCASCHSLSTGLWTRCACLKSRMPSVHRKFWSFAFLC